MEIDTAKDLLNLSILNYRIHEICQDDSKESNQSSMIQSIYQILIGTVLKKSIVETNLPISKYRARKTSSLHLENDLFRILCFSTI